MMQVMLPKVRFPSADATEVDGGTRLAPRPANLDGKTIGFADGWAHRLPDGSFEMYPLMQEMLAYLVSQFDVAAHKWIRKPNVSHPLTDTELEDFLAGVDVVINGECA